MSDKQVKKTVGKLLIAVAAMFAFGYALVPLYRVYCDLTGRGSVVAVSETEGGAVDESRRVTVVFDTNTRNLPWTFKAKQGKLKVRPGEFTEALFVIENRANRPVVGRAIPSVSPVQAGVHFNKAECFCFVEQALAPGERREVAVRFMVEPELPARFASLTLSYTFFNLEKPAAAAARIGAGPADGSGA